MNLEILLRVFETANTSVAMYGLAVALAVLATVVPNAESAVRLSLPAISPLWLVFPVLVSAGLLVYGHTEYLAVTAGGETVPVLFLAQIAISIWVLWGYRKFPWLVFPLAIVAGWIQWQFFLEAAARS